MVPSAVVLLLLAFLPGVQVVDPAGQPVGKAQVRSIGRQADEFATTAPDGRFALARPGEWLLVSHPRWAPVIVAGGTTRIVLKPPHQIRHIPSCSAVAGKDEIWMGPAEGFRIKDPQRVNEVAIAGEHDVHWFVSFGSHRLFVGYKAYLHPGLPEPELLRGAREPSVAGWRHGPWSGIDLRGRASDGTWWRWVGRDFDQQVVYSGASLAARQYFDRIMNGMCIAP